MAEQPERKKVTFKAKRGGSKVVQKPTSSEDKEKANEPTGK